MSKKSFLLHMDSLDVIEELSDEQVGKLLKKMKSYHNGNNYQSKDKIVDLIFVQFKNQFDRDIKKSKLGEYHWNWKGGITPENHKIRQSAEYKEWRKEIFKRDNFTCVNCGNIGGILNAHHIELFSINKDKRIDLKNGITLCKKCHHLIHKNK